MSQAISAPDAVTQPFIHITIPVGMLQCNCSIIADPVMREALVLDPGDEVSRILDLLGRPKPPRKGHCKHPPAHEQVSRISKPLQYTGAPVMMHREDVPLYQAMD